MRYKQKAYDEGPPGDACLSDVQRRVTIAMWAYLHDALGQPVAEVERLTAHELARGSETAVMELLADKVPFVENKWVLDLGAGMGALSTGLVRAGAKVVSVEPGAYWRKIAAARIGEVGTARVVAAVGESLPVLSECMNAVVSISVLEHVQDPEAVLREVFRVLKPGGFLLLSCDNYLSFWEPHYGVVWLPRLPKAFGFSYLRLLGRPTDFLATSITYTTLPAVRRTLIRCGFILERHRRLTLVAHSPQCVKSRHKRLGLQLARCIVGARVLNKLLLTLDFLRSMFRFRVEELAWKPPLPAISRPSARKPSESGDA